MLRTIEEEEANEMARLDKALSKGAGKGLASPSGKQATASTSKSASPQSEGVRKAVSQPAISNRPTGMPAWKLKELEKEKQRAEREREEATKKNMTSEAIKNRQLSYGIDSAFMTLRPGMMMDAPPSDLPPSLAPSQSSPSVSKSLPSPSQPSPTQAAPVDVMSVLSSAWTEENKNLLYELVGPYDFLSAVEYAQRKKVNLNSPTDPLSRHFQAAINGDKFSLIVFLNTLNSNYPNWWKDL